MKFFMVKRVFEPQVTYTSSDPYMVLDKHFLGALVGMRRYGRVYHLVCAWVYLGHVYCPM